MQVSRWVTSASVPACSWPSAEALSDAQLCSGMELQASSAWLSLPCETPACLCLARRRPEHLAMAHAGLAQDQPKCPSAQHSRHLKVTRGKESIVPS